MNVDPVHILAVDDDRLMLKILSARLEKLGYQVVTATNGEEALETLRKVDKEISLVIADKEMPKLGGLDMLQKMTADPKLSQLPVILQTGASSEKEILAAVACHAYRYLVKPCSDTDLLASISSAVIEASLKKEASITAEIYKYSFYCMDRACFRVSTPKQAKQLAGLICHAFPHPSGIVFGIYSLLINAIEHGNLCIGHKKKGELIANNTLDEEIEKRLAMPNNQKKSVKVLLGKNDKEVFIKIKDDGEGFDWHQFFDMPADRAIKPYGKGVYCAHLCSFDSMFYNKEGNLVTAIVKINPK